MKFTETGLPGVCILELEPRTDDRGFFARSWCRREFTERGLSAEFVQANLSYTRCRGTIRGMHYQVAPFGEAKLVRCIRGAIWDVVIDLRADSPTYLQWFGVELTAADRRQLYVPEGLAHGYQTLVDDAEVLYQVSAFYAPDAERGIRWNDRLFEIHWPGPDCLVSPKDDAWPDFDPDAPRHPQPHHIESRA